MSFLDHMAAGSRERLASARSRFPLASLLAVIRGTPPPASLPLDPPHPPLPTRIPNTPPPSRHPFLLFAEFKRLSPLLGRLDHNATLAAHIDAYARGGAAAISVLTEPARFGGSLRDLRRAASTTHLPVMRKDFLIDPYQVVEARAAGASGVLLIARLLSDSQLADMLHTASDLGMFSLVEIFSTADAQRAARLDAPRLTPHALLGVNARDLETLAVHPERLPELRAALPPGIPVIAESGLATPDDAASAARSGYDGALVGSALMRSPDPAALCRALVLAGNSARSQP